MKNLKLTKFQTKLLEDHRHLAAWETRRAWFRQPHHSRRSWEEIHNLAIVGLARAAKVWNGTGSFPAFARQRIRWTINHEMYGRTKGSSHARDARLRELPGDEVVAHTDDGEPVTLLDVAFGRRAFEEMQENFRRSHRERRLSLVAEAVANHAELNAFERRCVRLRYQQGLHRRAIAKRLRCSTVKVGRALHRAVAKLRQYFRSQGLETLSPNDPLPPGGNEDGRRVASL